MNNKRFRRLMDSVDPELLEEAKEPPRRSRKHFGSLAAMAACFVLLVGGVMIFQSRDSAQDPQQGTAQLANPIQTVTAAEVAQLGYRIPLPAEAQKTKYQLITLSQDTTPMAQVSFLVNDRDYTCRAVKTEQAEDISGIYQEWTESIDWAIGELQMQMRKAADAAWVGWFSATDGVQWCLSGDPDSVLFTAQEIVETLGYQMAVAPDGADQVVYDVLTLDGLAVGETIFVLDGVSYTYRTAATTEITGDFADISGLTDAYPVHETAAVSYCDARLSYEEGGSGKLVWFDPVPSLLYSLSMDSNASADTLMQMAVLLFSPAQGDVG